MTATLILNSKLNRERARNWCSQAPEGAVVTFKQVKRTLGQNDKLWAMLTEVAQQAELNGRKYKPDQWKVIFMNALGHEQDVIQGINGDWVPTGFKTSKLEKEQMSDLIMSIEQYCAEKRIFLKK
jgi:hypothetical protein|tara:strand:- start:121 stop:495 length:375 start_codon:yes stop_codon:yes gene_type:complete